MKRRNESGAIAIIIAILAITLIGLCAFVVDVGFAYANKRQIQTAADAAVLAAASEIAQHPGDCQSSTATPDIFTSAVIAAARAEAVAKVDANDMASTAAALDTDYSASCVADAPTVSTTVVSNTPRIFGNIFGNGDYAVKRSAAAVVEVGTKANGVRPLAICSAELPNTIVSGDLWTVFAPGNGHTPPASCPVPSTAGNWWTLDCAEELDPTADADGGGTSQLEDQVLNGCRAGVDIVPNQGTATGAALNTILANACPDASTSAPYMCLSGDPGQPDAGQVEDSWKALIDSGETVTLPVFCAVHPTSTPTCATSSITGTGTNTVFPVHKFVSVVVCGYHFSKQDNTQYARPTPTADCSGAAHTAALTAMLADDDNSTGTRAYLVLTFKTVQVSGGVSPSTCKIGDPCDGGTRQVRLVAGPYTE